MSMLKKLTLKGFKSIRSLEGLKLRQLNVLIGANGTGKSNFIAFFRLLNELIEGRLQLYVSQRGGPDALLHYGRRMTPEMEAELYFGLNGYFVTLVPTVDNRLVFESEQLWFEGVYYGQMNRSLGTGHAETLAPQQIQNPRNAEIAGYILPALRSWRVYHFHDTSDLANVKRVGTVNDNAFLRPDAGNLAAFLNRLQQTHPANYEKIRDTVRLAMPDFGDFIFRPWRGDQNSIALEWRERDSDYPFLAHQLSDGTLRFVCLATLLLQPELPSTIIIDEPELGLHPYALQLLAAMLRSASEETQLIIATQSVTLIDLLALEDILVVERSEGQSVFKWLDAENLKGWLEEYSLGELWMKNVLGGRPSR